MSEMAMERKCFCLAAKFLTCGISGNPSLDKTSSAMVITSSMPRYFPFLRNRLLDPHPARMFCTYNAAIPTFKYSLVSKFVVNMDVTMLQKTKKSE